MKADVERCHYLAHAAVNSINISKRRALEMGRCEGCFSCSPSVGGGTMEWMWRYLAGRTKLERLLQASEWQLWPSLPGEQPLRSCGFALVLPTQNARYSLHTEAKG